ncbi:MAG: excinuclease ABC subunit UvrC [Candidatus Kapabacteria bacterium]|nr:excinuclease ABC subunit UvrC [Candidatus Kapabacteria bacterium]
MTEEKIHNYPNDEFRDKVANLPTKPGIYQYFDSSNKIIYVGKAKNLRNRVKSYFLKNKYHDAKTKVLLTHIAHLEYIIVDSETEALLLEDNLIKNHKPKYNILLRDDKTYPFIRITNEPYPRVFITRTVVRDGSKYFGPYTDFRQVNNMMKIIRTLFLIRSCDLLISPQTIEAKKHRVCLDYHIKKCEGPCEGLISGDDYAENIRHSQQILQGRTREVEKILEQKMNEHSENLEFEKAAVIRNRYLILKEYTSRQKIISSELIDRDIFGFAKIDNTACSLVLKVREGKLIGKRHFIIKNAEDLSSESILQRTMEKWYLESDYVPYEILMPCETEDIEYLSDWLGKLRGKSIDFQIPKIGEKRKIIEMANSNAEYLIREYILAHEKRDQVIPRPVLSLQRDLRLAKAPRIIECFDNSHLQGTDLVSSMVYFEDGQPKKSEYRKFKNQTVHQNDDFAAMREAVERRYSRLIEEDKPLPDLIIVDGGKGQLSSAYSILEKLGIEKKVPIIGLAKRLEEVFFPGESESVQLPRTSSSLKLIQKLRDEAHRFAITYHRQLRSKRTIKSDLYDIKGIGKITSDKLLRHFGSVEKIKSAPESELSKILNKKQLESIKIHFAI